MNRGRVRLRVLDMSENKTTRANLVKALKVLGAFPVENRVKSGTLDVNYIGGWIECKYMGRWPVRADDQPVRFPHPLLQTQKIFIAKRAALNGTVLVCAQVAQEWFFWDGMFAVSNFEKMTRPEMRENALLHMYGMKKERLITWIKSISKG